MAALLKLNKMISILKTGTFLMRGLFNKGMSEAWTI
jgi:hypothetical protein